MATRLITFASLKGGVGKSTHVAALAAGLLDRGKTVRILETDEQGSSGSWADKIIDLHEDIDTDYLDIADTDFQTAHDAIIERCEGPDYVLLDTAGSANSATLAALYTADLVLSPFMITEWDVSGMQRTFTLYKTVFEKFEEEIPDTFIGLFMNGPTFMSNEDRAQLEILSKDFPILRGLPKTTNIEKWVMSGRTPRQLREGTPRAEGAKALTASAIEKAESHINALTDVVEEVFNA